MSFFEVFDPVFATYAIGNALVTRIQNDNEETGGHMIAASTQQRVREEIAIVQ